MYVHGVRCNGGFESSVDIPFIRNRNDVTLFALFFTCVVRLLLENQIFRKEYVYSYKIHQEIISKSNTKQRRTSQSIE